jgi:hypothetical protein
MATETALGKETEGAIEHAQASQAGSPDSSEELAEHKAVMARVMAEGEKRIHRSVARAIAMGIIDKEGNLLKKGLPPDMLPGADRDFGG